MRRGMWGLFKSILITLGCLALAYLAVSWHLGSGGSWDGIRIRAFLDAILAGVVGFTVVGSFTFAASLKKPEEDRIEDRIAYLYSAKAATATETNRYLKEQVTLLGAMITRSDMRYEAINVSPDRTLIHFAVSCTRIINNMMKHDHYTQTLPIRIEAQSIPSMDGVIGWVRSVQTTAITDDGQIGPTEDRLFRQHPFTNSDLRFVEAVALSIPPVGASNISSHMICGFHQGTTTGWVPIVLQRRPQLIL